MRPIPALTPLMIVFSLLAPFAGMPLSSAEGCILAPAFQELHDRIPSVVGSCTGDATSDSVTGDALQATTNGLLVRRAVDNRVSFTDGAMTWIDGPCGLQSRPNDERFPWELGGGCGPASLAPAFDPETFACVNVPPITIDRSWQTSAPRGVPGPVRPGEIIQLGLRNKFANAGEVHAVSARVIAPDQSSTTAATLLRETVWAYVLYPNDFPGARPLAPGIFTVVWETDGGFIACDGFVVTGYSAEDGPFAGVWPAVG
jgi:hypothetical protein